MQEYTLGEKGIPDRARNDAVFVLEGAVPSSLPMRQEEWVDMSEALF